MIIIGIDPHKSSLTAVAVDATGARVAARRFVVNAGTFRQLLAWSAVWPQRRFAVEGAHGLGRGLAQQLAAASEHVADVPATLARRVRLLSTAGGRKTDPADALSVAHAALHHPALRQVAPEDQTVILRLLSERRDDLARERTRLLNRLHQLLRELIPGGADTDLSADKAATVLRRVQPATATDACRRDLAKDLLIDLRRLDAQIKTNETHTRDALAAAGSTLPTLHGIGVVLAAKLLGHIGDATRFPTAGHFASYTGTAPLDASSGNRIRHRQLNAVLHTMAVCQSRDPGPGRTYYQRKLSEGKTPAEARRALKRRLANVVYRQIIKDQQVSTRTTT